MQDRSKAMEQVESTIVELGDMFVQLAGMVKGKSALLKPALIAVSSARRDDHADRLERGRIRNEHRIGAHRAAEVLPLSDEQQVVDGQSIRHDDHLFHRLRRFLRLKFPATNNTLLCIQFTKIHRNNIYKFRQCNNNIL